MADTPQNDPIATAQPDAGSSTPPVGHVIAQAVIQTISDHPDIPPAAKASVAASILSGLEGAAPAIFAVSRAGVRTQTQVSLGLGILEMLFGAFSHR